MLYTDRRQARAGDENEAQLFHRRCCPPLLLATYGVILDKLELYSAVEPVRTARWLLRSAVCLL